MLLQSLQPMHSQCLCYKVYKQNNVKNSSSYISRPLNLSVTMVDLPLQLLLQLHLPVRAEILHGRSLLRAPLQHSPLRSPS